MATAELEERRERPGFGRRERLFAVAASPIAWIAAFVAVAGLALALPLRLPMGVNYWDTLVYFDALHRIALGQVPHLDFFAPVGPLGYYLVWAGDLLFPRSHPLLLANWAMQPLALPALALVVLNIQRRSRAMAFAVLLPYLVFSALPINLHDLYPLPGLDGVGHYNRHIALLLYILIAALMLVENRRLLVGLVAWLLLVMVLTKVTGALAGALLVGYAVVAGRLRLRDGVIAAAAVLAVLAAIEAASGLIGAYAADILTLVGLNTGALLPRFLTVASVKFIVVGPVLVLLAVLAAAAVRDAPRRDLRFAAAFVRSPAGWLAAAFAALTLFETQNTGSLEYIGLWPILLLIGLGWAGRRHAWRPLVVGLVAACALPSLMIAVARGARAVTAIPAYLPLGADEIGRLGRVSLKRELHERAHIMLPFFAAHRDTYADLAAKKLLPGYVFYSEIDSQATWLLALQDGLRAIRAHEDANKLRFNGFFTFDFVDPFNLLLGREPPRHVPIGLDPSRSNPPLTPRVLAELHETDALLEPTCPTTVARQQIKAHFAPALEGRRAVELSPCWTAWVRPARR